MVGIRKNILTAEQCANVISAAQLVGFKTSALRDSVGGSYYNEDYRESSVSFIKPEDLSADTWNAIHTTILGLNEEYYNARLTEFDMQVSWYQAGQLGFDWHSDDPPYPTDNILWSGRKLTYVFELSDSSTYQGGYLDIDAYNKPTVSSTPTQHTNIDYSKISAAIANLDASEIVGKTHVSVYIDDYQLDSKTTAGSASDSQQQKREQGDCVVFPSFFNHKVHPMTSGNRYSLTVWAKGPLWV
jgi:hypothetical protein